MIASISRILITSSLGLGNQFDDLELAGLRRTYKLIRRFRLLLFVCVLTGFLSAILEFGVISILGLGVAEITGQNHSSVELVPPLFREAFAKLIEKHESHVVFVGLVILAVAVNITKNLLVYSHTVIQLYLYTAYRNFIECEAIRHVLRMPYPQVAVHPTGQWVEFVVQSKQYATMGSFYIGSLVTTLEILVFRMLVVVGFTNRNRGTSSWSYFIVGTAQWSRENTSSAHKAINNKRL